MQSKTIYETVEALLYETVAATTLYDSLPEGKPYNLEGLVYNGACQFERPPIFRQEEEWAEMLKEALAEVWEKLLKEEIASYKYSNILDDLVFEKLPNTLEEKDLVSFRIYLRKQARMSFGIRPVEQEKEGQ